MAITVVIVFDIFLSFGVFKGLGGAAELKAESFEERAIPRAVQTIEFRGLEVMCRPGWGLQVLESVLVTNISQRKNKEANASFPPLKRRSP